MCSKNDKQRRIEAKKWFGGVIAYRWDNNKTSTQNFLDVLVVYAAKSPWRSRSHANIANLFKWCLERLIDAKNLQDSDPGKQSAIASATQNLCRFLIDNPVAQTTSLFQPMSFLAEILKCAREDYLTSIVDERGSLNSNESQALAAQRREFDEEKEPALVAQRGDLDEEIRLLKDSKQKNVDEYNKTLTFLGRQVDTRQNTICALQKQLVDEQTKLVDEKKQHEEALRQQGEQHQSVLSQNAKLQKEKKSLESQVDQQASELATKTITIANLQKSLEEAQQANTSRETLAREREERNQHLQTEVTRLTTALQKAEGELAVAVNEKTRLLEENNAQSRQIKILEGKKEEVEQARDDLQVVVNQTLENNRQLV
jgi:myosin heavy subunit